MQLLRFLPDNQYQAALNANAPTALNPFATMADLAGLASDLDSVMTAGNTTAAGLDIDFQTEDRGLLWEGELSEIIYIRKNANSFGGNPYDSIDLYNDNGEVNFLVFDGPLAGAGVQIEHRVSAVGDGSNGLVETIGARYLMDFPGGHSAGASLHIFGEGTTSGTSNFIAANSIGTKVIEGKNNGVVEFPALSTTLIDTGAARSAVTKEWVNAQGFGNGIFDAANDGGTVPSGFDVALTDTINYDSGTFVIDGANNNVGVGSAPNAAYKLDVNNGDFRAQGAGIANTFVVDYSTSRVGIWTATPTAGFQLDVNGIARFGSGTVTVSVGGNPSLSVNAGTNTNSKNFTVQNSADGEYFTVTSGGGGQGRVGINTTAPSTNERLHVNGAARFQGTGTTSASYSQINVNSIGTETMRVQDNGIATLAAATVALIDAGPARSIITKEWFNQAIDTGQAYTPTNVSTDRSFDADSTSLGELADIVGTLISDLQSINILS